MTTANLFSDISRETLLKLLPQLQRALAATEGHPAESMAAAIRIADEFEAEVSQLVGVIVEAGSTAPVREPQPAEDAMEPASLHAAVDPGHSATPAPPVDQLSVVVLPGRGVGLDQGAATAPDAAPELPRPWTPATIADAEPLPASVLLPRTALPASANGSPTGIAPPGRRTGLDTSSQRDSARPREASAEPSPGLVAEAPAAPVDRTRPVSGSVAPVPSLTSRMTPRIVDASPAAAVFDAIREVRAATAPAPRLIPPVMLAASEMRRAIPGHLDVLGHRAPWTPALDLRLVEDILAGFTLTGAAERLDVTTPEATARWEALTKPIKEEGKRRVGPKGSQRWVPVRANNIDGQAALVAELRRRAGIREAAE